ncbi:MAG TPA: hypothetical protein VNW92_24220 [Polyangiaceae bacterium]|jgi:hypothetical protein|nr:hypothetical protein [Polyangiaceae bacterium]
MNVSARVALATRLALTAGLALTAVGCAFALAASPAMAHEFIQKPAKAGFQIKGGAQTIKSPSLTVECAEARGTGSTVEEKSERLPIALTYSGCKAAGAKQVTVSEAQLKLNANETLGLIEQAIVVKAQLTLVGECEVTIPTGSANENLGKVNYTNLKEGITAKIAVTEVTFEVKEKSAGGVCGKNGEKAKGGEYKGEGKAEVSIFKEGEHCDMASLGQGIWTNETCTEKNPIAPRNFDKLPYGKFLEYS